MKKVLFYFLCFSALSSIYPQNISPLSFQQLTDKAAGEFYYPKLSPDGSKVFFTSVNYNGLWSYDLQSKQVSKVTSDEGAGYCFTFSSDSRSVVYRKNIYNDNGLRTSQTIIKKDLSSLSEQVLASGAYLSVPEVMPDQSVVFTSDDALMSSKVSGTKSSSASAVQSVQAPVAQIEHQKIALYVNGQKKVLSPLGEGNYIWPSVSPDGSKLLFTKAGKGTFVSDLNGNVIASLGYANAPKWSPDGKWVIYMNDKDDGLSVTGSDIFAYSITSQKAVALTSTTESHEMYPEWSADGKKIVFNTEDGKVFLMELKAE